ncbi:hypothetical protein ACJX0J_028821, partial [Zea mays]
MISLCFYYIILLENGLIAEFNHIVFEYDCVSWHMYSSNYMFNEVDYNENVATDISAQQQQQQQQKSL